MTCEAGDASVLRLIAALSKLAGCVIVACLLAACQVTHTASPATPTAGRAAPTPSLGAPAVQAVLDEIVLPAPRQTGPMSVEEAMAQRRSVRAYTAQPLTLAELSQLLWACQGITSAAGLRTAPSAGALYPLEVYLVTADGVYHYVPQGHRMQLGARGDVRQDLAKAAVGQAPVADAPASFVITAVYARTEQKYGAERTPRYVHLEAGHAAQNVLLQAVALGLGGVPIGAFYDDQVQRVLGLPADHQPLYIIPVGHPR